VKDRTAEYPCGGRTTTIVSEYGFRARAKRRVRNDGEYSGASFVIARREATEAVHSVRPRWLNDEKIPPRPLRAELNLSKRINAILPVQSLAQKYSGFRPTQITCLCRASRPAQRGVWPIVTDVGCGMRWTRKALLTNGA
jgi:hypothetical protein